MQYLKISEDEYEGYDEMIVGNEGTPLSGKEFQEEIIRIIRSIKDKDVNEPLRMGRIVKELIKKDGFFLVETPFHVHIEEAYESPEITFYHHEKQKSVQINKNSLKDKTYWYMPFYKLEHGGTEKYRWNDETSDI